MCAKQFCELQASFGRGFIPEFKWNRTKLQIFHKISIKTFSCTAGARRMQSVPLSWNLHLGYKGVPIPNFSQIGPKLQIFHKISVNIFAHCRHVACNLKKKKNQIHKCDPKCYPMRYHTPAGERPLPNGAMSLWLLLYRFLLETGSVGFHYVLLFFAMCCHFNKICVRVHVLGACMRYYNRICEKKHFFPFADTPYTLCTVRKYVGKKTLDCGLRWYRGWWNQMKNVSQISRKIFYVKCAFQKI